MQGLIFVSIIAALFLVTIMFIISRIKRCPADKILVVYGKTAAGRSSRCVHGGYAFIIPVIQDYQYLDLTPMSIEVNLRNALSSQNIRVDVPSRFTVGISTEAEVMMNAAERLLGLNQRQIIDLSSDILFGQLRLVIATMNIEEINSDRDKFLANVSKNVEAELSKIGLKLINVNVTDIKDESGYIEALGKEAAAQAINDAKKSVAEKNRDGAIGEANAKQDERVQVASANAKAKMGEAEAHSGERISVSDANAKAVEGENKAKIFIASSEASRREAEAESNRKATAAEKVAEAKALEEAYAAEMAAEKARADREKASQEADIIIPAEIEKRKVEIAAEAEAERIRRHAKGEADALYAKLQAEAKGNFEILMKQAEGFGKIVESANGQAKEAVLLMIADKLPELVKTQVEAIKNIQIDKVTVWDNGGNGESSTAGFIKGMAGAVPPMKDLFNMAGMELPEFFGKEKQQIITEPEPQISKEPEPSENTTETTTD